MPPNREPASTNPIVIVSPPRDPGFFSGADDEDIDQWLSIYERVSTHNRWDDTFMLANLPLNLKKPALTWFQTNEARLTSWDQCKQELRDLFGNSVTRQLAAKKDLSSRVQSSTESYVAYILDVLALCSKVDSSMPESDKVGHILKGIADDAFTLLICKDCTTVESVLKECRRFEEAKCRRVAHSFFRLPHTAATSSCADAATPPRPSPTDDLPTHTDTLTTIVRREIEAMAPAIAPQYGHAQNAPTVALIQAVVREEVANLGIHPVCALTCSHAPASSSTPFSRSGMPSRYDAPPRYPRRSPNEWRTADNRPICFNCSRVGHVSRYCRYRWSSPPQQRFPDTSYSSDRPYQFMPGSQQRDVSGSSLTTRFGRSPSPQRRQSRSAQPRRPSSPPSFVSGTQGN